jgi:hypothetical protein
MYDAVELAEEDDDYELPLDEVLALEDVAEKWEATGGDLSNLVTEMQAIQDRRDATEAALRHEERIENQPTLFDPPKPSTTEVASIFDRL